MLSWFAALSRQTVVLVSVALLLLAMSAVASWRFSARWQDEAMRWRPQLAAKLETVQEIRWRDADLDKRMQLAWDGSAWISDKPSGYPADRERIVDLLVALSEARLAEEKTSRVEDYGQLGLRDVDVEGSRSRQLTLVDDDGTTLLDLLIGDRSALRHGNFLRRVGEAQSWLSDRELQLPESASSWLQLSVLDLPYSRLASLRIVDEAGSVWTFERDSVDEEHLRLVEQPEFMRLRYAGVLNAYGRLLQDLQVEGVESAGELQPSVQWQLDFKLRNGLLATAQLRGDEEGGGAQLWLSFSGEGAEAEAEAEQLRSWHAPWRYQLSEYSYDRFQFRLGDVLEVVPDDAVAADADADSAAVAEPKP